eukprot:m.34957 g.34957  ORF g.34957 m.34957 type:complete len:173 (-) comp17061_c0_seq1:100-618(-)
MSTDRFNVKSVTWRPFQLRPNHPPQGVLKAENTPSNPRVGARMKQAGLDVDINFTGLCDRSPNTLLTHVLMDYALKAKGDNNELAERLFKLYFTDGVYPDVEALTNVAKEIGLDADEARKQMTDATAISETQQKLAAYRAHTSSVPMFIINGKPAFSGAQPAESILQAFERL